jgi:hypothetical protein
MVSKVIATSAAAAADASIDLVASQGQELRELRPSQTAAVMPMFYCPASAGSGPSSSVTTIAETPMQTSQPQVHHHAFALNTTDKTPAPHCAAFVACVWDVAYNDNDKSYRYCYDSFRYGY